MGRKNRLRGRVGAHGIEGLESKRMLAGDLIAHWQADDLNETVDDQAVVTAWNDSSGGVVATASGQPTLIKDAIGGRSVVRFEPADGVDALRVPAANTPLRNAGDFSVIAVFATDSNQLQGDAGSWYDNSGLVDANTHGISKDWGVTINGAGQISAGMGGGFGTPSTSVYSDVSGLNNGQLQVVTLARSGGELNLYVGDQLAATTDSANADPRAASDLAFGTTATGNTGFAGDLAEVRIYDGQLTASEVAAIQTQIQRYYDNSPPVAMADAYTFPEDADFFQANVTAINGVLSNDFDPDGDSLTAELVEGAAHGKVTLTAQGSFVYDSDPNYFGTDQFTYVARDFRPSEPVTVTLTVTPRYDPAVAFSDDYRLLSGNVLTVDAAAGVLANDQNPDQVVLQAVVAQDVNQGQLTLNADGSFRYDPQGFAGNAVFEYQINDGTGLSNVGRVTIVVNSPPVARDDTFTIAEDTPLIKGPGDGVTANDFDAEQNPLTVSLISPPSHGTLTLAADGAFSYTPDDNFFGSDQFSYQLDDGEDLSNVATARITINSVNDAPVAHDDTYFTLVGQPLMISSAAGLLRNDSDIENDPLSAERVTAPQNGSLTLNADGSLTYQPQAGFTGVDSFQYRARDGQSASTAATVRIAINSLEQQQAILINEVHVDPDIKTELVEFIELHNPSDIPIDVSGWTLRNAVGFVFPEGASVEAGGYLVVTQDPDMFRVKFGGSALGPWEGKLSNEGEEIELWSAAGDLIDRVDYQVGFPWPTVGETPGPSMQLLNPQLENDLGGSWQGALPTPGTANSVLVANAPPQMRQVNHSPFQPQAGQPVTITAHVTDPDGVQAVSLAYQLVNPGDYFSVADDRYQTEWTSLPMHDDGQNGDAQAGDDIYSVIVPGDLQTHRRLVRYRITATDTQQASRTGPYLDDPQPNFAYFVYNGVPAWTGAARPGTTPEATYSSELLESIPVYHLITTHEQHVDSQYISDSALRGGYTGSDYRWEGTLIYDGMVYDHINFRARGGVWRYAMGKNMWKFDFEKGHEFQARDNYGAEYATTWDKLNFSAIIQQGDYRHRGEQGLFESVGFKLFDLAGTESPNTHYVHFRIITDENEQGESQYDGDFQGLYLAIEQPDGNFLDEHDLPDGNFYKMEGNAPESTVNQGANQVDDASDVRAFTREFLGSRRPSVDWWTENLDLARYYGYQAISQAIHHYDTAFGKNFYYFHNPETGKWQIHPWDLDLIWADNMYGNENHEFNVKVAKNADFNEYVNQANIDLRNRLNAEYQNVLREIMDLLYNPEQTGMLIDQMASIVYQPGELSWVDADRAMWDYNPINATASRYTNSSKNAVNWKFYAEADTKDYPGMIQLMKDYIVTRSNWMTRQILTNEANIPGTPSVNYLGDETFPLNGLSFQSSAFASPIGAEFAGLKWRIAEVTDPNSPEFDPYDRTTDRKYEMDALWESDVLTSAADSITIPAHLLEPGRTYRVRVRMLDNDNHWSHWSEPTQFVASAAVDTQLAASLRISEVNYNPHDPTPEERAAGFSDNNEFEFIELVNLSDRTLDLTGASLDQVDINGSEEGVGFEFATGAITQLAPGARLVVVENLEAFAARYGTNVPVAGQWSGRLSNGGETITLAAFGSVIQQFAYDDGWYDSTDGEGATLEIVNPNQPDLELWNVASAWQASTVIGGTPGQSDAVRVAGDSNHDGLFNSADLVLVMQFGEYEDSIFGNSTWEEGDWNGDGDFTTDDLVYVFTQGTYTVLGAGPDTLDVEL